MKLSLSAALPLLAAFAMPALVSSSQTVHQHTTFEIVGADGEMEPAEAEHFAESFADVCNLAHKHGEGAQVVVSGLTIDSQGGGARQRALRADTNKNHRKLPNWGGGWTGGDCNHCHRRELEQGERQANEPDLPGNTEELHRRFELTLAAVVVEGPFTFFDGVTDIHIDFGASPPSQGPCF